MCVQGAVASQFATAIWAPAGLGLGALLVCGKRFSIGIWIGSLLANSWIAFDAGGGRIEDISFFYVPAEIATGSTLAAIFGAWLIKRFTQYPKLDGSMWSSVGVLFFGGIVSTTIAAVIGPSALYNAGLLGFDVLAFNIFTWWIGDSLGVLLVMPIVITMMKADKTERVSQALRIALPCCLLFMLTFVVVKRTEREQTRLLADRFNAEASSIVQAIINTFDEHVEILRGMEIYFRENPNMQRRSFKRLAERSQMQWPSVRAIKWMPRVARENLNAHLDESAELGLDDYYLYPHDDDRWDAVKFKEKGEYFPVNLFEPLEGNEEVLGLDFSTEPKRNQAIQRAIDTHEPSASPPLVLKTCCLPQAVADKGKPLPAIMVFQPVVHSASSFKSAEDILGLYGITFAIDDLLSVALRGNYYVDGGVKIRIRDAHSTWEKPYFFERFQDKGWSDSWSFDPAFNFRETISVAGRTWVVEMRPDAKFLTIKGDANFWYILKTILVSNFFVISFILISYNSASRTEKEVRKRTKELTEANIGLEISTRNLQDFVRVASHDLREPLRTITDFMILLRTEYGDVLDDEARKYIEYCVSGSNHMKELIADVVKYSDVDTEVRSFENVSVDDVLNEVLKSLDAPIEEAEAKLTRGVMPMIHCDRSQLYLLLHNLIENAIKHRGQANLHINVGFKEGVDEWIFFVQDNGIGIAQRHHDRVFELFQQLHPDDSVHGTGIGLPICKRIVERHNGRIWIESLEGQGTTFFFSIRHPDVEEPSDSSEEVRVGILCS